MTAKTKRDPMAWFRINCGEFITETTGLSNAHVGIYMRLLCIYWSSKNTLELSRELLIRRAFVLPEQVPIFDEVLEEFFPVDSGGDRKHIRLDQQLDEIIANSALQSNRAKLRYQKGSSSFPERTGLTGDSHDF